MFARTGATTGKSFLIRECPTDAVFASYLIRVRVGDSVDPRFVSHFFQTPMYWAQIARSARGVAQPGVNATTLKALEIPLPPLAEQRWIAEVTGAQESGTVRKGATLVCCIGATIGKMGTARERSAFNQQINAVEWSQEVDDIYGFVALRFFRPTIKMWGASTTLPILKKSSFEKIEIPIPPLSFQREFSRRFESVENLRRSQLVALNNLDELFSALQYRAFRGEL